MRKRSSRVGFSTFTWGNQRVLDASSTPPVRRDVTVLYVVAHGAVTSS
jgi:hypothetical protein